jgi:hypothetical protein
MNKEKAMFWDDEENGKGNWREKAKQEGLESGHDKEELTHLVMGDAILELERIIKTDRRETIQLAREWIERGHGFQA